jgi:glycosyltransferase involved in cell wall biosynthesis
MKIAFIASRDISEIGGIENYMANLCPILADKNHEVILYTEGNKYKIDTYKEVKIIRLKSVNSKFLNKIILGFKATINVIRHHKNVDIIHYNAMAAGLFSFIPRILGKKVIFQLHGIEWQRKKWAIISKIIIKTLEAFVIRVNNNIIAVSQEQSNYIKEKFNKKCTTIFTGANLQKSSSNSSILEKYGISKNKYILYLGRLVEEKKADLLIKAFNNLENNDIKLVISGGDKYSKKYIEYLYELASANKNIIFTSSVFNNDKDTLLNNCLLFCIPSEMEGLPITLLEAMSFKKICIASNIPAHKEALGDNGIFFETNNISDLKEKLNSSFKNYSELKYIEEANYLRIEENFTWEIISNQYENYCEKILQRD